MNRTSLTTESGRHDQSGMTLVEMLVVLAIIAVMASVTALAVGGGGAARNGQAEAMRLEARLQLAADRSMIDGDPIALMARADEYRFVQWNPEASQWQNTAVQMLDEPHALPRGMNLTTSGSSPLLPLGADSGGEPFALTLTSGERRWVVEFDGMTARTLGDGKLSRAAAS